MGSTQEDRQKVELFHFLVKEILVKQFHNCSKKCGTAHQKVEQVLKAGHCSTNCRTVPQLVEQLLLKGTCYSKMWKSRYATFNFVAMDNCALC